MNTAQPVVGNNATYRSTITVSSFRKDHLDVYNCTATINATSPLIITSGSLSGNATIGTIVH